MAMKGSRRDCKHRRENGTTGLGILPSDYIDRGDGLLIGLDSFTGVNRTHLIPKSSPVSFFLANKIFISNLNVFNNFS